MPELPHRKAALSPAAWDQRRPAVRRTVVVLVVIAVALYGSLFVRAWMAS